MEEDEWRHARATSVATPGGLQTQGEPLAAGGTGLTARIWHGQTLEALADDYTRYLDEEGVRVIARIPGNRGVQMLRMVGDGIADFLAFLIGIPSRPSSYSRATTMNRSAICPTIPNT